MDVLGRANILILWANYCYDNEVMARIVRSSPKASGPFCVPGVSPGAAT